MSLVKGIATVGGLTGVSRIAGFIRDILMASVLGAGPVADAFFVALKLPNLFRRITAEGAFSVSFVPLYAATLEEEGEAQAALFAGRAFTFMFWALLGFTVFMIAVMPWVIYAIAPGFADDPQRYDLALEMTRVTFPYLLLISLTSLLGGILNAHNRFAPFAAAPIFFNLTLIGFLLSASYGFKTAGHALAWGVLAAGFVQFALLWFFIRRFKVSINIASRPQISDRLKKLFRLMGPGIVGAGVVHINLFADVIIASLLEPGAISYLYYADRLNQLPLGLVGIAVGTALLPMLSRSIAGGRTEEAQHLFNRSLEACMFLALPAAVGLFMAAYPIVLTLFEHGAFGMEAAIMTTTVLTAYALGMPAYIAGKVYSTAYWAQHDTTSPVKASIVATLFNIALSLWLVFYAGFGVVGIAAATALAGWLQLALLAKGLRGMPLFRFDDRFKKTVPRIVLSCLIMAAFLYAAKLALAGFYLSIDRTFVAELMTMLTLVGGGGIIYGLSLVFTGAIRLGEFGEYFKRK